MLSRLWPQEGATHILYPMMALVALTFAVLLLIPYQRFKAGREGRVSADDFRFGESSRVPPTARCTSPITRCSTGSPSTPRAMPCWS